MSAFLSLGPCRCAQAACTGLLLVVALGGCAEEPSALQVLRERYAPAAEYSVILADMKEEGNFFHDYFHRYRVVHTRPGAAASNGGGWDDFDSHTSEWMEVDEATYERYAPYLGMTILSRDSSGAVEEGVFPAGYGYVGDERYGYWDERPTGGAVWVFRRPYVYLGDLFPSLRGRNVYRRDWDDFRAARTTGRPWLGRSGEFGTTGTWTREQYPDFFARRQAREASFDQKVRRRVGRSQGGTMRNRSSGFGK